MSAFDNTEFSKKIVPTEQFLLRNLRVQNFLPI